MFLKGYQTIVLALSITSIAIVGGYLTFSGEQAERTKQIDDQSFTHLGSPPTAESKNQFSQLNAQELTQKADAIILNADALLKDMAAVNTAPSKDEQEQIASEIARLEQKIQTIEQSLKP